MDEATVFLKVGGINELREEVARLIRIMREFRREWRTEMANQRESIEAVTAKVDDLIADVKAQTEILERDRDNLSPEGEEALNTLAAKVEAFDAEVGDADGSDAPAEPAPAPDGTDGSGTGTADGTAPFGR